MPIRDLFFFSPPQILHLETLIAHYHQHKVESETKSRRAFICLAKFEAQWEKDRAKTRLRTTSLYHQLKDSAAAGLRAMVAKRKALKELYKERETRRTLQAYTKSLTWGINQCLCRVMKSEAALKWITASQESLCDTADRFLKRMIQGIDNHCQHTLNRVGERRKAVDSGLNMTDVGCMRACACNANATQYNTMQCASEQTMAGGRS